MCWVGWVAWLVGLVSWLVAWLLAWLGSLVLGTLKEEEKVVVFDLIWFCFCFVLCWFCFVLFWFCVGFVFLCFCAWDVFLYYFMLLWDNLLNKFDCEVE